MQIIDKIESVGLTCFSCNPDKTPNVKNGQDWRNVTTVIPGFNDNFDIGGLPIPKNVLIIDLDLYKGITRDDANIALGCEIPWDESLIQKTQNGGEHHAFYIEHDVEQRNNYPIKGLDTKIGDKGYICFGKGYTPVGAGIVRLANLGSLIQLPTPVYAILGHQNIKSVLSPTPVFKELVDVNKVKEALSRIYPDCGRDEWRNVGYALKHGFGDNPKGFELFDSWSRGNFHDKNIPDNYVSHTQYQQWNSFKQHANNGITINSLYHYAGMKNPKRTFIDAGDLSIFLGKSESILEKHKSIDKVTGDILDVEDIQHRQLSLQSGRYLLNAKMIIKNVLDERVSKIDEFLYWWSGRSWQDFPDGKLDIFLWETLPDEMDKPNVFNGLRQAFLVAISRNSPSPPCKCIFFRDGVFDITTGSLDSHNKENYNTGTLSINSNQITTIPKWNGFLTSIFGNIEDDRVKLLQEIFGWCFITHNLGIEKYIAFTGVSRAGKGTILKILMKILGEEFCKTIEFTELGHPRMHETLRKYNVVLDFDAKLPEKNARSAALSTLLKMTANENISSRRFHTTKSIHGQMNTKLLISCNKIPALLDDSAASANRAIILLFDKTFYKNENLNLINELESELAGITQWGVKGIKRLMKNNCIFTEPISSLEQQKDLKNNSQPLNEFIEEHVILESDAKCSTYDLFEIFKVYCERVNFRKMSRTVFIRALKESLLGENLEWKLIRINNANPIRGVIGLRINNPLCIPGISTPIVPKEPTSMKN